MRSNGPVIDAALSAVKAAADQEMSYEEAAEVYLAASDHFGQSLDELEALGPPPAIREEDVRLAVRALETYEEGYLIASRGLRSLDVDVIAEGGNLIEKGTTFVAQATDSRSPCP